MCEPVEMACLSSTALPLLCLCDRVEALQNPIQSGDLERVYVSARMLKMYEVPVSKHSDLLLFICYGCLQRAEAD